MVTRLSCLCLAFLGILLLSGCANGTDLNCVSVNVIAVGPARDGSLASIPVKVRYINENVVAVGASDTYHELYLNGEYVGKCHSRNPVGMQAEGEISQDLTFTIEKPDYVRQLAMAGKLVNYRLDTRLDVYVDTEHLEVKATGSGTVNLTPLLAAK